ncbi:sensor histidine kinase [Flavobacterium sp.]|uniref:sensor histidine kinase n=1 Tax=Flavobacterium sp. TaxID=239 RepID=UPI004033BF68
MKGIYFLTGLFLVISFQAAGQKGMPPVYELKSDTGQKVTLGTNYFQILPNTSPDISLDDVLHESADGHFTAFNDSLLDEGVKRLAWFRFRIRNSTGRDHILSFSGNENRSDFYIKDASGKWKRSVTGYSIPYGQRNGVKRSMQVLFPINDGDEIVVYKRMEWGSYVENIHPSVTIYDPVQGSPSEEEEAYFDTVLSAALFGFMVFAALFNFFFYYIVRERVYLFYAITLVTAAFSNILGPFSQLFFRQQPHYEQRIASILIFVIIILILLTLRLFLNTRKTFPVWDKFLLLFPVFIVVISVVVLKFVSGSRFNNAINYATFFLVAIYIIGIIAMLVIYLKRRDTNARLLTIALIPFFLGILISMGDSFQWVSVTTLIWAVGVISWSLFVRFRALMEENSRQALEKEKLAREKEEERNTLIAQQNELLEKQVAERTADLTRSLAELKQTQNQLIQSEKMASLGELTAGIAHEIQNPLNFVNNFSDVSVELLQELKEEVDKGDLDEVKAIADDVTQNLEKIAHHGRRADGIVRGMLQHSRASSGQKEPTDINALADEYLRLAYHGLRAKDKSFNAELITHFAQDLPKVDAIPQDLGRVLLNLFTNAFYATQEKKKSPPILEGGEAAEYKPVVTVTTKQSGNSIEIIVKDNGIGIPDAIKDKILQPFFTTKPTGEGTGLGLSLSYDIVVKGHGGTIDIESAEGEGAEFIITLPMGNL